MYLILSFFYLFFIHKKCNCIINHLYPLLIVLLEIIFNNPNSKTTTLFLYIFNMYSLGIGHGTYEAEGRAVTLHPIHSSGPEGRLYGVWTARCQPSGDTCRPCFHFQVIINLYILQMFYSTNIEIWDLVG